MCPGVWGEGRGGVLWATLSGLGFDTGWRRATEGVSLGAQRDPGCVWLRDDAGLDQGGGDGGGEMGFECCLGRWSRQDTVKD